MSSDSEPKRTYSAPPRLDRAAVERLLNSEIAQDQVDAMHAALFSDPDDDWVLNVLLGKMTSSDRQVRYAAAAFGASSLAWGVRSRHKRTVRSRR